MRKDAKLGFAIGGILLAVLAVYFLIDPNSDPSTHQVVLEEDFNAGVESEDATAEASGPVSDGMALGTASDGADRDGVTRGMNAASIASEGSMPIAPVARGDSDWDSALTYGQIRSLPPLMSTTPAPEESLRSGQQVVAGETARVVADQYRVVTDVPAVADRSVSPVSHYATARDAGVPHTPANVEATYIVQSNDTLSSIALNVYGSANYWPHLQRANADLDPTRLRPGDVIKIPSRSSVIPSTPSKPVDQAIDSAREYRVQSGDSLYKISMRLYGHPRQIDAIYDLNRDTIGPDRAKLKLNQVLRLPEPPARTAGR